MNYPLSKEANALREQIKEMIPETATEEDKKGILKATASIDTEGNKTYSSVQLHSLVLKMVKEMDIGEVCLSGSIRRYRLINFRAGVGIWGTSQYRNPYATNTIRCTLFHCLRRQSWRLVDLWKRERTLSLLPSLHLAQTPPWYLSSHTEVLGNEQLHTYSQFTIPEMFSRM